MAANQSEGQSYKEEISEKHIQTEFEEEYAKGAEVLEDGEWVDRKPDYRPSSPKLA
jgi:hypothetical protein